MQTKNIILTIFGLILLSIVCGYGLVFAGNTNVEKVFILSKNIFIDKVKGNTTSLLFQSKSDLSKQKITADCDFYSKLPEKKDDYYLYELEFFNESCRGKIFKLESINKEKKYYFSLDFYSKYSLLKDFLDMSNDSIQAVVQNLKNSVSQLKIKQETSYYKQIIQKRKIEELEYLLLFTQNILLARGEKYKVPVDGEQISTTSSKIPNAGRPYRSSFTDGIHHGWDIPGKLGESVLAIDDGIIVRTVDNFEYRELDKIVYGNNLSYEQKLWNLDILRGKQVWLKTMKGDVVFYSHLNNVFTNIKEGTIVKKGQPLGTIGKTGVPGKDYHDYHIHFPIHKNPYNKIGKKEYSFEDYMKWDWLFKGESKDHILEHQDEIFE